MGLPNLGKFCVKNSQDKCNTNTLMSRISIVNS